MDIIIVQPYQSPVGPMLIGARGDDICLADWECNPHRAAIDRRLRLPQQQGSSHATRHVIELLEAYFSRRLQHFDLPLWMPGTPFQQRVWQALLTIPYGATVSYAHIARVIDRPRATRAVAAAIGANPISIIVPCHRVIGSNGTLTGYAGSLPTKHALLTLESPSASSLQ